MRTLSVLKGLIIPDDPHPSIAYPAPATTAKNIDESGNVSAWKALGACSLCLILSDCAPYARDISPAAISTARYDGWDCAKLQKEKSFVDESLTRVSADQDGAADHDALMVFLIGVPTSGGGVKGEVAELKGEQKALHEALLDRGCL